MSKTYNLNGVGKRVKKYNENIIIVFKYLMGWIPFVQALSIIGVVTTEYYWTNAALIVLSFSNKICETNVS